MGSPTKDAVEALLVDAQLERASRMVRSLEADVSNSDFALRRLARAVLASCGRERDLAAASGVSEFDYRTAADVERWGASLGEPAASDDYLVAAVVLASYGESNGVYASFRRARELAEQERRHHIVVAACERLAHHALLFGDLKTARTSLEEGIALATAHGLSGWRAYCAARLALLAFDAGDLERSTLLVEEAHARDLPLERRTIFAPIAVRLAAGRGDPVAVQAWSSGEIVDLALNSDDVNQATAAIIACVFAADTQPLPVILAKALRRGLRLVDNPSNVIEFLALAARVGESGEAQFASDLLRATFAPQRLYLNAHHRLAEAYILLRNGDATAAIDAAGDAARAFDAIGMRRWANEAMLLLVRRDDGAGRVRRRPTAISLTRREEQVAHLIRRGASNREVAHALQISEHTVERHVSSILSRLGLRSRWQIVDVHLSAAEH